MEKSVLLTIIIPAYNAEGFLERSVASCYGLGLAQEQFEILIIDDGSRDQTLKVAKQLESQHQNIAIIHQENQGQAVARNVGMDRARGKFLMFLDADDYYETVDIAHLLAKIDAHALDAVIFRFNAEKPNGETRISHNEPFHANVIYTGEQVILNNRSIGSVCCYIFKTQFLKGHRFRFVPGIKHEDVEFNFSMLPHAKAIMFVDDVVYHYCYNLGSTDRTFSPAALERGVYSDLFIASNLIKKAEDNAVSSRLQCHFRRHANSLAVSSLRAIKRYALWKKGEFNHKLAELSAMGLYPIKGATLSWKTTIAGSLLSFPVLLKIYMR